MDGGKAATAVLLHCEVIWDQVLLQVPQTVTNLLVHLLGWSDTWPSATLAPFASVNPETVVRAAPC